MKFKKLLGGGLLATVLALGVGAGLTVHSESKEADADAIWRQNLRIYFVPSNNWGDASASFKMNYYDGSTYKGQITGVDTGKTYDSRKMYYFHVTDETWVSAVQFLRMNPDGSSQWNYSATFDISDSYDSGVDTLLMTSGCPDYDNWNTSTSGVSWSQASSLVQTFTVTKYAVFNDAETQTYGIQEKIVEGITYEKPANATWGGYHFDGWYREESLVNPYVSEPITANLKLYAKFVALTQDSYFYYVTGVTTEYVHTYGGDSQYGWKGNAVATVGTLVNTDFIFQGHSDKPYVYRIPFSSIAGDTKVIIHKTSEGGDESASLMLKNKTALWWSDKADYHNDDAGAALDFLLEAEALRKSKSFKDLSESICGVSKTEAAALLLKYDALDSTTQTTYIDCTTVNTYDPSKSADEHPSKVNSVKYSEIIAKLREIASGNGPSTNTKGISLFGDIDNSTPIMLVVIISVVSLTAVGGYIFLKRRKEN